MAEGFENNEIGVEVKRALDNIAEFRRLTALAEKQSLSAEDKARLAEIASNLTRKQLAAALEEGSHLDETKTLRVNPLTQEVFDFAGDMFEDYAIGTELKMEETNRVLGVLDDIEHKFHFAVHEPFLFTMPNPVRSTVMQWYGIDEKTNNTFMTQVYQTTQGNNEHFVINRLGPSGQLLDYMVVKDGGHGTTIGLEWEEDTLWIWANLNLVGSNDRVIGNELVRFPYKPNKGLVNVEGIQRLPKFNNVYTTPTFDVPNGFVVFRFNRDGRQVLNLRRIADVKAGIDDLLAEVVIPEELGFMQGVASDGYRLYWYSGDANAENHLPMLTEFDFRTGELVDQIECDFGAEADGNFLDNFREPEGIFHYTDPSTGQKALLAGITVGATGKRVHKIYAFSQRGALSKLLQFTNGNVQRHSTTLADGRAKFIPADLVDLKVLLEHGRYYMTTADTLRIKDHPDPGTAGWWVDVGAGTADFAVTQVLKRNSVKRKSRVIERVVVKEKEAEPWAVVYKGGLREAIPDWATAIAQIKLADKYYMTTADTLRLSDHPDPGTAGWFLDVGEEATGSTGSFTQIIKRNSVNRPILTMERVINQEDNKAGDFVEYMTSGKKEWYQAILINGAKHSDMGDPLRFAVQGGLLFIRGRVVIPPNDPAPFARVPSEYCPDFNWWTNCAVGGSTGSRKIVLRSNGLLEASGLIANRPNAVTFVYFDLVIPMN